jgi:hypothetical protein
MNNIFAILLVNNARVDQFEELGEYKIPNPWMLSRKEKAANTDLSSSHPNDLLL